MTEPSSAEASRDLAREGGPKYARCRRRPDGDYSKDYLGEKRMADAWRPEEDGAVCVIDTIAGGRIAIYTTEDRQWMRVSCLP